MRLQGYDYSRAGLYYLTIMVQNRLHLYGYIHDDKMILNDAGKMVEKWYHEIERKFPDKQCHEKMVMPNHFHCIIENKDAHVEASLRGRPENVPRSPTENKYGMENQIFGATIGDVMDWFKTMTTNEYIRGVKKNGWQRFDGKLWQRNYYDHIIRNIADYQRISRYIIDNPTTWKEDEFNDSKEE